MKPKHLKPVYKIIQTAAAGEGSCGVVYSRPTVIDGWAILTDCGAIDTCTGETNLTDAISSAVDHFFDYCADRWSLDDGIPSLPEEATITGYDRKGNELCVYRGYLVDEEDWDRWFRNLEYEMRAYEEFVMEENCKLLGGGW